MSNREQQAGENESVAALVAIVGAKHVLTSPRTTAPFARGSRFGSGGVLAVVRPGDLVELWRALRVCVERDLIVIPQAANTGLTGGSGPGDQGYDRDIVIISTMRIDQIHLIHDAREAICLAGAKLYDLEAALAPHGREPHSVIGSTSIGATVVGGIANNSGGSQVRKGPAFTSQAVFATVDGDGQLRLVNHLGMELADDPEAALAKLQRGDWSEADLTPPPPDSEETAYAAHVRQVVDSPARFNADPTYLFEASGSAGKLMVFAVRTPTFPLQEHTTTFYIGVDAPSELEAIRREFLASEGPLPISGEYLDRTTFDLAAKYGKDTFLGVKYIGSRKLGRMFAAKTWANGVFAKVPFLGDTFADSIAQAAAGAIPYRLPQRLLQYRDRYEHHLILEVSSSERHAANALLATFFAESDRGGDYFECTDDEAESAMLQRFGAASAIVRYFNLHRGAVGGMVTFDVALRRNDDEWREILPPEVKEKIEVSAYYGHFFCHVMHQNHVVKRGVDLDALKGEMEQLLRDRGAVLPAEHNYGRLYDAPEALVDHYKQLDPRNVFNAGVGQTSSRRHWE